MSDAPTRRRIRAQASATDADVMGFVLDAPVQAGRSARFDGPGAAPLARALFSIAGVRRVEARGATVWVRKAADADWAALKPGIAAAIRRVLDETGAPLDEAPADPSPAGETPHGPAPAGDPGQDADAELRAAVEALLERQVNPAVAAHGGHISAERVAGGTVYLRMSGGCQGCAASAATLRQGVERMLRAALPQIGEIVDVTDHASGTAPFYARQDGPTPVLSRPVPPGVIGWDGAQVSVDPDYLAPRLGLTPEALREGLHSGDVAGVTEAGEGADAGRTRIVLRSATRAWAAEILPDGSAREIPPPPATDAAAGREQELADRVRAHLAALGGDAVPVSYGALARALGLWAPGSIRRVTRALEITMREDAAAGRPFIAARAVGRGGDRLPGRGFFDLARALARGPGDGEDARSFHAREIARLERALSDRSGSDAAASAPP